MLSCFFHSDVDVNTYFERLNENDRGEEAAQQRCQPFLAFQIAEFNTTHDDEEDRHHRHQYRNAIGDEQAPPWKRSSRSFLRHLLHGLLFHLTDRLSQW